jgi:hypothetical protein
MGRRSAHHRKIAVFGWLAFALAVFYVGVARLVRDSVAR